LKGGNTPLIWAAVNGRADCIGPLVGAGAKLEAKDSVSTVALVGWLLLLSFLLLLLLLLLAVVVDL